MKAGLFAAMHDPYGDWSRYVSGECLYSTKCLTVIHF